MRKITLAIMLLTVAVCSGSVNASDTNLSGRLYGYWKLDLSDNADSENEFVLSRAYLTVKSKLSEFSSVRITTDLRETEDITGKTRYGIILKYGYLDWTPQIGIKNFNVRFGLQPARYIDHQNKLWGRRYLSKTVSDLHAFMTTSDLGISAHLSLGEEGERGSLALAVLNGTSYTDLGDANKQKDINLFAMINPLTESDDFNKSTLIAQYYKGTRNISFNDSTSSEDYAKDIISFGSLMAYRELFNVGVDLNWQTFGVGSGADEIKRNGFSIHSTLYLADFSENAPLLKNLNLFARFDSFDPNTNSGFDNDAQQLFIIGIERIPTKGIKTSISFRSTSFDDSARESKEQLYLSTLFKF